MLNPHCLLCLVFFYVFYHFVTDPQMREYSCKVGTHFFPLSLSLSLYLSLSFLLPVYEGVLLQRWHQLRSAETNTVHGVDHIRLDKKFFLVLIFVHFFQISIMFINYLALSEQLVPAVGRSAVDTGSLSSWVRIYLGWICLWWIYLRFFCGLFCGAPGWE